MKAIKRVEQVFRFRNGSAEKIIKVTADESKWLQEKYMQRLGMIAAGKSERITDNTYYFLN
jgi:hypothetical protein